MDISVKNKSWILFGGLLGLIIGPLTYLYRINPDMISTSMIFISRYKKNILITGIVLSILYLLGAVTIQFNDKMKNKNTIKNASISIGIFNMIIFIVTILPTFIFK